MNVYRTLPTQSHTGLETTVGGRLYATGQPEPEWLRRRYEHAEVVKHIQRDRRAKVSLQPRTRGGLVGRLRTALGFA